MIHFKNTADDSAPVVLTLEADDRSNTRAQLTHDGRMVGWIEHKNSFLTSTPCQSFFPPALSSLRTDRC